MEGRVTRASQGLATLPLDAVLMLRFGYLERHVLQGVIEALPAGTDLAGALEARGLLSRHQADRIRSMRAFLRQRALEIQAARNRGSRSTAVRAAMQAQERDWLDGRPVRALAALLTPSPPSPRGATSPTPAPREGAEPARATSGRATPLPLSASLPPFRPTRGTPIPSGRATPLPLSPSLPPFGPTRGTPVPGSRAAREAWAGDGRSAGVGPLAASPDARGLGGAASPPAFREAATPRRPPLLDTAPSRDVERTGPAPAARTLEEAVPGESSSEPAAPAPREASRDPAPPVPRDSSCGLAARVPAPLDAIVTEQGGLRLRLSDDRLRATLERRDEVPLKPTLADVQRLLHKERIVFGVADPALVSAWLAEPAPGPLVVAVGEPAVAPVDGRLELLFEDPRPEAGATEGPPVAPAEAGAMLAFATAAVPGRPGHTVHGLEIAVRPAREATLRPGRNVEVTADGHALVARVAGRPSRLPDGRICVHPPVTIAADLGVNDADLESDGEVSVGGTISGRRVVCGRLVADEVVDSELTVESDVRVRGTLSGSVVRTEGSFFARAVRRCRLEVAGDVVIEREIVDCEIRCSGRVRILRGRVVDSRVVSRRGLDAHDLGSERSAPCLVQFGTDPLRRVRVQDLQGELAQVRRALRLTREALQRHEQRREMCAQERVAAAELLAVLHGELTRTRLTPQRRDARTVAGEYLRQERRQAAAEAEETAQAEAAARAREAIAGLEQQIRDLRSSGAGLLPGPDDGVPGRVRVTGTLHAGTVIAGPRARVEVPEDQRNVTVRERNVGSPEAPIWRMVSA